MTYTHGGTASASDITPALLERYDRPGPRYTSYPSANAWAPIDEAMFRDALARAGERKDEPLSLYVHIPFCSERCAFCGCNVIISRKEGVEAKYVDYVERELDLLAGWVGARPLSQVHWGGGTPTFLAPDLMERLHNAIWERFSAAPDAELALEMDPRVTTPEQAALLRRLGFNRASMGVQDLDTAVQVAIGRRQTEGQTRALFTACRDEGFTGVNIDLVYGLPGQTPERWGRTLDIITELNPDRLAVYSYAHLPEKLHNQRRIDADLLPSPQEKYALFAQARRRFLEHGYRAIGMDHFAAPEDELTRAMDARRLRRNFMGYTVQPAAEMIGVGVSAISEAGGMFAQNVKKLSTYYGALDAGQLPVASGYTLSGDDRARGWVIHELMCNFHVDFAAFQQRFGHNFGEYFVEEAEALDAFARDGFLARHTDALEVLPLGQAFIRNIAMAFDAHLRRRGGASVHSRTV